MQTAIIIIYTLSLVLVFVYSLAQLHLLINYLKAQKEIDNAPTFDFTDTQKIPTVTVQLPLYNELYVTERLLENISLLDYPKDKLEIQVLDDSTDETVESTKCQIEKLQNTGLDIKHITRSDRKGFKAGALKEGLKSAKGEFIAIFDADFMPKKTGCTRPSPILRMKILVWCRPAGDTSTGIIPS